LARWVVEGDGVGDSVTQRVKPGGEPVFERST
jgi:hypothetical protein